MATLANRAWNWDQPTIRLGLTVACLVVLAVVLVAWAPVVPARWKRIALVVAGALTLTWMLAGQITSSRGAAVQSKTYAQNLPQPLDWIDRATGQAGTTFIGQDISSGQALGINLLEFWNRSVKNIWSLDGSAPGPGPVVTPDLADRFGTLTSDPGLPFVVATDRVNLVGPIVATRPGQTLRRIDKHPWRLREASYGVSDDGWISGSGDGTPATGTYAYFGPERTSGTLTVAVSRAGFCAVHRAAHARDRPRRPGRAERATGAGRAAADPDRAPRPAELPVEEASVRGGPAGRRRGHRRPDGEALRLRRQ